MVSTERPYHGRGSLEVGFDLVAQHPNRSKGEVYVDLRFKPPPSPAKAPRSSCRYPPFDLEASTVSAEVLITPEMYNPDDSNPNGLQLLLKSSDDEGNWSSFYGAWHDIELADVDTWKTVTAVPSTMAPPDGYADPQFDPRRIVAVGLKLGTGESSDFVGAGRFWIDDLTWPGDPSPRFGFESTRNPVEGVAALHANYASVLVTWYMESPTSDTIAREAVRTHSDDEVVALINALHSVGVDVLLKPHVDVADGTWRALIQPAAVGRWFASYTDFITHYAEMAEDLGVSLFAVGTELESLSGAEHLGRWLAVIDAVKAVYGGQLTYAANWDGYAQASILERQGALAAPKGVDVWRIGRGYKSVSFWQELDFVGIDAYFPLSDAADPSLGALVEGWAGWLGEIEAFAQSVGKPVIFTEIGYPSRDFAARDPWAAGDPLRGDVANAALQARAYEAAFRAFQGRAWFRGLFWWNWLPRSDAGGSCDQGFTAQGKPAEKVLRIRYDDSLRSLP
jgi:hypothetical protein